MSRNSSMMFRLWFSCKCELSWFRRRKKQKTQHVYTRGSVTPSITMGLHARGDADMKSWEELVNDVWSMWDWCGGCAAGTEATEKNFDTDSPDGENSWALGFMICWMDHEPSVRSLETAAIRTLRPRANNELGKKRKRTDIERSRPPPGLREKLPARALQSILVTYNKTKTRGKQVRPRGTTQEAGYDTQTLFHCTHSNRSV